MSGGRYEVIGLGDYNGDNRDDLLWKGTSGDMVMWFSLEPGLLSQSTVNYPAEWSLLVQ